MHMAHNHSDANRDSFNCLNVISVAEIHSVDGFTEKQKYLVRDFIYCHRFSR